MHRYQPIREARFRGITAAQVKAHTTTLLTAAEATRSRKSGLVELQRPTGFNYQRLYKNGYAWQVIYVWEKNLRTGGDYGGENGDAVDPYSSYVNSYVGNYAGAGANTVSVAACPHDCRSNPASLPGAPNLPASSSRRRSKPWQYYKALNRWENYMVDTNTPPQHLQFNFLVDFPFGRGKRWLGNANKPLNEVVGGWQLAGAGRITVTDFAITNTNWGPTNPLKKYKKSVQITDCTSGTCLKEYEWFNGYIAPTAIAGSTVTYGCAGKLVQGRLWPPHQLGALSNASRHLLRC